MKNNKNIIIKGADKWSAAVVWDREDYIKEVEKQLRDSAVYEEVPNDPEPRITTEQNRFEVKDPKFARFYLLLEIHKRLNNVPGRPVISNCGYHMENICIFRLSSATFGTGS